MDSIEKYSLMVCSGFYEVKAYSPQIMCLMESFRALEKLGIEFTYVQIAGDSYVSRAKNNMVHQFLKSKFTHLMIIDSDETWNIEGFLRLLRASMKGCEIVAGLYPCKNNWDFYGGVPRQSEDGFILGKEDGDMRLIEMECAPGGFLIYAREAFERTRPALDYYHAPETDEDVLECFKNGVVLDLDPKTREELASMSHNDLVEWALKNQTGGRIGNHTGEDIYFQRQYKRMGGVIWCEPNIDMGHIGVKEWKGNYQEHLLNTRVRNRAACE